MADRVVLVEINYDTKAAIDSLDKLTESIEAEKAAQKQLKDELKAGTITQAEYAQQMEQSKEAMNKANAERKATIQLLGAEKGSVNEIKAAIKQMTIERDKLNQTTKDGQEAAARYNQRIEELRGALRTAQTETGRTQGAFGKFLSSLESTPGPLGGVVSGIMGMVKASLAFIATPIGAVISAIIGVLMLLKKAFMGTEEGQNKARKGMAMLSGAFNALMDILRPVADFLINSIIWAFDKVGKAAEWAMGVVSKALKGLGFDKAAEAVSNYTQKIKENIKASQELADMEAKLQESQRLSERIQLDYQKRAEKLRQLRDDESKSIRERIAANTELGNVLKNQLNDELKIAQLQLDVARKKIKTQGKSTENLDAEAEALTKISDIQERITGQESEQLANLNSLRKEAADKEKARQEERMKLEQKFLDVHKAAAESVKKVNQDVADFDKALMADFASDIEKNNAEIQKLEDDNIKVRTESVLELAKLKEQDLIKDASNEEEKKKAQIAAADAEKIRKIDASKGTAEELELIEYEHQLAIEQIKLDFENREKERHKEELEERLADMQMIIDASRGMADERVLISADAFAKISTINWEELEDNKAKFVAIAGAAKGLTNLITAGYQKQLNELDKQKEYELSLVGDNADAKAMIEEEYNKKADKLKKEQAQKEKQKAIVDSLIATAIAVVKSIAASPLTGGLPFSAIVGALGAAQTAYIASQPAVYAKGGMIGGNPHSQGGTKFWGEDGSMFEAEKGEAMFVLKKDATAEIAALSALNESFGGRSWMNGKESGHYADGGEVSTPDMSRAVAQVLQNTPIIVRVEDIATGMSSVENVKMAGVI
jgi:hypothetical protein